MLKINEIREGIFITNANGRVGLATLHALCYFQSKKQNTRPETIYVGIEKGEDKLDEHLSYFQNYPFIQFINTGFSNNIDENQEQIGFMNTIKTIFIIPSTHNEKLTETMNIITSVELSKIPNVLLFSIVNPKNNDRMRKHYYLFEEKLKSSDLNYKILRAGFFMENLNYYKNEILFQNNLSIPIGNGEFAPISVKDLGTVASKLLLEYDQYPKKIYSITGSQNYTGQKIAEILSKYLNKTITYKSCELLMDTEDMKEGRFTNIADVPITSESTLHNAWLNENGLNARCPCHKPDDGKNEVISLLELCQSVARQDFNKISMDLQQNFHLEGESMEEFLNELCQI